MVKIRGLEFDVSFTDADTIERYEEAAYAMKEAVADKNRFKGMSTAEAMREQCRIMENYIDQTLDANASEMLFGGKMDLLEHMEVCEELNVRAAEARKAVADISNKYTQKQQSFQNKGNGPQQNVQKFHGGKNHGKGGNR